MEKVLINKRGEAISFNTELNSITPMIDNITCNLYLADKDGQVVTNNEVIDVKKGEFILYCRLWLKDKYITKTVIISDPTTTYDLNEWYKELNKQDNETI